MLSDEHLLFSYQQDFGKILTGSPAFICIPPNTQTLQEIIKFSSHACISLTIRGNGMSQSGQSLAEEGGLVIHMQNFNQLSSIERNCVWADVNCSWHDVTAQTALINKVPPVLPYNGNLSIGGVLSAGGIGASSFKYGAVVDNIEALEVVCANGDAQRVDKSSPLFYSCLAGQGQFAVITRACLKLHRVEKNVRTFMLLYIDKKTWLSDMERAQESVDYIEAFCTPAPLGAKLGTEGRVPFAHWFYALHLSVHFDEQAPPLPRNLNPGFLEHVQDETLVSYLHRHDGRFSAMRASGAWELGHPWYECFLDRSYFTTHLDSILARLPLFYANIVQCVPIVNLYSPNFLMLPPTDKVMAVMILNPGIVSAFIPAALATIAALDKQLLPHGTRYLSGYLGENVDKTYWENHFGARYSEWLNNKKLFDSKAILSSLLFKNIL